MIKTTADNAATNLQDLLRAAAEGEQVFIEVDDSECVIQLVAVPEDHPWGVPKAGSAKGWFILTDAFDEPLEDFAEYER